MDFIDNLDLSQKQVVTYSGIAVGTILIAVSIGMYTTGEDTFRTAGTAVFMIGLLAAFLPYGVYSFLHQRHVKAMENYFPPLLEDLAEAKRGGTPLPQAIQDAATRDYGALNEEVQKMADQLSWGIPLPEVLERFMHRVEDSDLMRRGLAITLQSYQSGGDIAGTIDSLAQDAMRLQEAEQARKSVLGQQILIIYAIYFLFIGIIIGLLFVLGPIIGLGDTLSGVIGGGGGSANFCASDIGVTQPLCDMGRAFGWTNEDNLLYYRSLFLFMILIEGVFNGLVAGQVGEGKVAAGVKHSLIMTPIGFLVYLVAVALI